MKHLLLKSFASAALLASGASVAVQAQYSPTPKFEGTIGRTLEESKESRPKTQPVSREGAPNIVWILIDDIGYGASSAFGGLIETPNIERLANQGLRYTNFHTTAFSAPTRAALLTGRNQHSVHFGFFAHSSYDTPGYDGYLPFEKATAAEILRENGYNTFAIGKYHLTHPADATQAGPVKELGKISTAKPGVEGLEVGEDRGTSVSALYKPPFAFTGSIKDVTLELK